MKEVVWPLKQVSNLVSVALPIKSRSDVKNLLPSAKLSGCAPWLDNSVLLVTRENCAKYRKH